MAKRPTDPSSDFIRSVVELGNSSWQAGYDAGFLAGQREGINQCRKIFDTWAKANNIELPAPTASDG